jgi:hypothetical protein
MNDLDLRAALHRDADLVGEPAADLLDQLSRRRRHQQRQRTAGLTAVLGVVLIGAAVPVGQSLMTRSDPGPAAEITVDPTPSVTPEAPTTPPLTPPTTPPVSPPAPETAPETAVDTPPVSGVEPVACPHQATLLAILDLPSEPDRQTVTSSMPTLCSASGEWALAVFNDVGEWEGQPYGQAHPRLFRYVDGAWIPEDREQRCTAGEIPDDVWELICNAG